VSHPNTLEPLQYIPGNIKVPIDAFKIKKQTLLLYCMCSVNISMHSAIIPAMFLVWLMTAGMVFMTPWFGGTVLVGQSSRWIS